MIAMAIMVLVILIYVYVSYNNYLSKGFKKLALRLWTGPARSRPHTEP